MPRLSGLCFLFAAIYAIGAMAAPEPKKPEPLGAPAVEVEIQGVYEASGTMPDGGEYHGVLVRIRKRGNGFSVQWDVEGGLPAFGTAMRRGSELIVGFHPFNKTAPSVARYVIEANGPKLVGVWMLPDGLLGTEELVRLKDLPPGK